MGENKRDSGQHVDGRNRLSMHAEWCCAICARRLRNSDPKVVLPSKAFNSVGLPLGLRVLCSDCYLDRAQSLHEARHATNYRIPLRKSLLVKDIRELVAGGSAKA